MSRKLFAVLAVLAVLFAAGSALAATGTRDLYLVSTDGIAFVPQNGALGANLRPTNPSIQCGIRGAPGSVWAKSFDAYQAVAPIAPPGWCKYWIRGFAGTNGPVRDPSNEATAGGAWKPPAAAFLGKAQLPAPIIDVTEGEDVFVHLANIGNKELLAPSDPHTIHLHGQQVTTQNDGFPESSWVVPVGAQAVYYFYAERPGSYMYHCHVEASEHVQMGMYGALIIRPADFNPGAPTVFKKAANSTTPQYNDGYDNAVSILTPNAPVRPLEYIFLLGDVDMTWHEQVRTATNPPDAAAQFRQNYWLINGRSFPDTILPAVKTKGAGIDNIAPVAVTAPVGPPDGFLPGSNNYVNYGTVYEIPQFGGAAAPRVLVRYIDISYVSSPMHFHGWHFRTVGIDGNPVPTAAQKDEYTVGGASGKTYDLIITANARDAANLPGSQYAAKSPALATNQVSATPAKEFFLLPTGFPALYNLNGLTVPGSINGLAGTAAAALGYGFADVGATQSNAAALVTVGVPAGFPPAVTVSGPTMLPAGAAAQMQLVANLVNAIFPVAPGNPPTNNWSCTPNPLVAPPLVPPAGNIGTCGWATGPANTGVNPAQNIANLNPFTVPGNITDLWYPTHDHNDFKVTNNGLYPGGAIGLLWAHGGGPILPRP